MVLLGIKSPRVKYCLEAATTMRKFVKPHSRYEECGGWRTLPMFNTLIKKHYTFTLQI